MIELRRSPLRWFYVEFVVSGSQTDTIPSSNPRTPRTPRGARHPQRGIVDRNQKQKQNHECQNRLWHPADKIQGQKDSIALIERELDVLQRENKLRAADYYADAGTRLRDEKKYADDDRKYRDQIDAKQKELDDAKTKLDDMRDEARKAGASPGAIG